LNIPNS